MVWKIDLRKSTRPLVLCAVACSAASTAAGQTPLTLAGALAMARERNPDLAAAREAIETARAQRGVASQFPNPVLTATTTKIPTDGTRASTAFGNGLLDRSYDSTLALAQLVEIGGKRRSRRVSAEESLGQARSKLEDSERLLVASVVRTYVAALSSREAARIGEESAAAFSKTARLAAEREEGGEISRAERTQVEIAAGRWQAEVLTSEAAFRGAVRSLEALVGLPTPSALELGDRLEALLERGAALEIVSDADAMTRRPDLQALESALRRAGAELDLQRALRLPDPTLVAQYERQPPDQRNTVGFGVAVALPILNRNAGQIAAAQVALSAARRELELGRRRVRSELASTRDVLEAAAAREGRYSGDLLPRAESVRATVEYAYAQGAASFLELLEAERNANEIRLAAANARADLIVARADFAAARMIPVPASKRTP